MSIKPAVDRLYRQNTNYAEPVQATNQAASLKSLSDDLYQNARRFIYELLQNADDASVNGAPVRVALRLFGDRLVVAHTGKPFDERDVRGICAIDDGTKKNSPEKTGFKGIGFKAVFGQSNRVSVFSAGEYFSFDATHQHPWNTQWAETPEVWEQENDRKFEHPWQIIPVYTAPEEIDSEIAAFLGQGWTVATIIELSDPEEIVTAIDELSENVNMYLFLKHVSEIGFMTGEEKRLVIEHQANGQVLLKVNGTEKAKWLKRTVLLNVPPHTRKKLAEDKNVPVKLKTAENVELTLAAKLGANGLEALPPAEQLLYAYLPTEERKFRIPVLVNSAFYTVSNREALHEDSAWNEWLFQSIPEVLLQWIAELVMGEWAYQAYNILPGKLREDHNLGVHFNSGFTAALRMVQFVKTTFNELLKVHEALVDNTYLSEQNIISGDKIRAFKMTEAGSGALNARPYVPASVNRNRLKGIGVASFEWSQLKELLRSDLFADMTIAQDQVLIGHLSALSRQEKMSESIGTLLPTLPFILDHEMNLKLPSEVFFPAPDQSWDITDTELSFVHPELVTWLSAHPAEKNFLEGLGVVERSDVTYLIRVIIPQAATFITPGNAIKVVRDIFNLYDTNLIGRDVLAQLGELSVLSTAGSLRPVRSSFLSTVYLPQTVLETTLQEDIFVSADYIPEGVPAQKWKLFFLEMGASETISLVSVPQRTHVIRLRQSGFFPAYFDAEDKKHQPAYQEFTSEEYENLITIQLLDRTVANLGFAKVFWQRMITTVAPAQIDTPATSYWGRIGMAGRINGTAVINYVPWFARNVNSIPTTAGICAPASAVFLNSSANLELAGKYLPVFDGPDLSPDWRNVFAFKQQFALPDLLALLTNIALDDQEKNLVRIQSVYAQLLDGYANWSEAQQNAVRTWAATNPLAGTDDIYRPGAELCYFADGDPEILEQSYHFIRFSKSNWAHPSSPALLALFQVRIIRQSDFQVDGLNKVSGTELRQQLLDILPFLAVWMKAERSSGYLEMLADLELGLNNLEIFQADKLTVHYSDTLQKNVNTYYHANTLYVVAPWLSPKVMLTLPCLLRDHFKARGYLDAFEVLLRSNLQERIDLFEAQDMELPPLPPRESEEKAPQEEAPAPSPKDYNFKPKERKVLAVQWALNEQHNRELIAAAAGDSAKLLLSGLQKQRPGQTLYVFHFSHIENAVSIIKDGALKSRAKAQFKDSAGSGVIAQTVPERKAFARFYFRPKSPTQYYVENLGRGAEALLKLNDDPLCPVPVFFIVPLAQAMQADWSVSIGSLASPQVEYGHTVDIVGKFDFEAVYKTIAQVGLDRFLVAAHQEFLVRDELDLNATDYLLGVQDQAAKDSLLAMLGGDQRWADRIKVLPNLYEGDNPRVSAELSAGHLSATLTKPHEGQFVLQYCSDKDWNSFQGNISRSYNAGGWITVFSKTEIGIEGAIDSPGFNLFYAYKGHLWLVQTNTDQNIFQTAYIKTSLEAWYHAGNLDGGTLLNIFKLHPELTYWYDFKIGDQEGQSLEQHTLRVLRNFQEYFGGGQSYLQNVQDYLVLLALHDIGKPAAIVAKNKYLQHEKTLAMFDDIEKYLPIDADELTRIKLLIDQDILGRYMNPTTDEPLEDTALKVAGLAVKLNLPVNELWPILVTYYQCDAAGYRYLRDSLFVFNEEIPEMTQDGTRLVFRGEKESKFLALETRVKI